MSLDNICLLQNKCLFEYAVFSLVREVNISLCPIRPHVQITCREQVPLLSPPVKSAVYGTEMGFIREQFMQGTHLSTHETDAL